MACRAQIMDQVGLCMACWGDMQFINAPFCDVTGAPLPFGSGYDLLSIEALENPPHYDKARIAVKFNPHSQRLIHRLKYQDQQHIAPLMAKMMVRAGTDLLVNEAENAVICPVPLHHWRYVSRRFNQADLLAKNIAKITNAAYMPQLIKRVRPTKTQVGLTRAERQGNVKDAFTIDPKLAAEAKGKAIYIVDDVITTGATVDEISKNLKALGLEPVYILAFAKVIQEKVI